MGLDLIIVSELYDTITQREKIITDIPCTWYRNSGYTDTQFDFTKHVGDRICFDSDNLIKFGKSLIDMVVPDHFLKRNYDYNNIYTLLNAVKSTRFLDEFELKLKITNLIYRCNDIEEITDILIKYTDELKLKITNRINKCQNIEDIARVLITYHDKISTVVEYNKNHDYVLDYYKENDVELSNYSSFYKGKDLDMIDRVISLGLTVIHYGQLGYKAYWSF